MRKLVIAAVIACSFSAPAMAACHGHPMDGKWISDFESWSDREKNEMIGFANALKHRPMDLPPSWFDPRELANGIDQLECGGVSHDKAIQITIQLAISVEAARNEPMSAAANPSDQRDGAIALPKENTHCPAKLVDEDRCLKRLATSDANYLRQFAAEETARSRGTTFLEEATNIGGENFHGLAVTVVPPQIWTPERRKQFGVDVAQRYCAFLGSRLFFEIYAVRAKRTAPTEGGRGSCRTSRNPRAGLTDEARLPPVQPRLPRERKWQPWQP